MRHFTKPLSCLILLLSCLFIFNPSAEAETTDWIFANSVSEANNYTSPTNILERDGNVATASSGAGLVRLRNFNPVDFPDDAEITRVEIRFHLAGVRTTYRFKVNSQDCRDHENPGFYKDFNPSRTTVNDYIVNYTDQDCIISEEHVQRGDYEVEMLRYLGTANYSIDDISVRFVYEPPTVSPTPTLTPTPTPSPTPSAPTPFLDLPWDYEEKGLSFNEAALAINAYFDHTFPFLMVSSLSENFDDKIFSNQVTTFSNENSISKLYSRHDGYDYGRMAKALLNEPMRAAAGGTATLHASETGCGNAIYIDHGNRFQTRYCHLQKEGLIVKTATESAEVTAGQQIGKIGWTGNIIPKSEDGAHIHFMVVYDKDGDGNFNDNIPDGLVDPYGWQSKEEDPWENHTFTYATEEKTGSKSYYLWKERLDNLSPVLSSNGGVFKTSRYVLNFPANSTAQNLNLAILASPTTQQSNLVSIGSTLDVTATDLFGNSVTQFLHPFNLEVSFAEYDLNNIDLDSLSVYSSPDGNTWNKEDTIVDLGAKKATAQINHLTQFALMGERIDTIAPVTEAIFDGQKGTENNFRSDVSVSLNATDNKLGVDYTLYRIDDGEWNLYSAPFTFENEGTYKIEFYSTDNDDNVEELKSVEFIIDKALPEVEIYYDTNTYDLVIEGTDDSGETATTKKALGLLQYEYSIADKAGNATKLNTQHTSLGKHEILQIRSIQYNDDNPIILDRTLLAVNLIGRDLESSILFNQYFQILNTKKLDLLYRPRQDKTIITEVINKNQRIVETIDGVKILRLETDDGIFKTSY